MDEMMIKILKSEFGKHFWNQIKMINSYKELPKEFRRPQVFGPGFWDHYSKLGQFFYITVPPKKYLVLLPSGVKNPLGEEEPLRVSDENGKVVNPFEVEGQLRIAYMGLKLEDLLKYYRDHRVSNFRKIEESKVFIKKENKMSKTIRLTEQDLVRLVKRVIQEQSQPQNNIDIKQIISILKSKGLTMSSDGQYKLLMVKNSNGPVKNKDGSYVWNFEAYIPTTPGNQLWIGKRRPNIKNPNGLPESSYIVIGLNGPTHKISYVNNGKTVKTEDVDTQTAMNYINSYQFNF